MNIESICSKISSGLTNLGYKVNLVSNTAIDPEVIRNPELREQSVMAFEFIVNDTQRFITFAVDQRDGVYFTRCKSGSIQHLASLLKTRDFNFTLGNDIYSKNDLLGKFLERMINDLVRIEVTTHLEKIAKEAFIRWGVKFHVCSGYRVIRYHKSFHSFDAEFEIQVRPDSEVRYKTYTGTIMGGNAWKFYNTNGDEVGPATVFSLN